MPDGFEHLVVPPLVQIGEYQTSVTVELKVISDVEAEISLCTQPPSTRSPRRIALAALANGSEQGTLDYIVEVLARKLAPIADADAAADLVRRGYSL